MTTNHVSGACCQDAKKNNHVFCLCGGGKNEVVTLLARIPRCASASRHADELARDDNDLEAAPLKTSQGSHLAQKRRGPRRPCVSFRRRRLPEPQMFQVSSGLRWCDRFRYSP